ncbi:COPII coat complex component Sec16 putative (Sec16) [Carpediemonas membranifera]|uniref:COPII coat complex component Sec16 putative (Sec16) n=1 Tax=Carpediemonas membranifera TaxID=201153 RepID=A0A8J6DYT2_9EUKA|nr:COPII coat complex component Sec16 putative (Sec16) [Carpediemonas membranifera]|eukprot:KAG9389783.1 COPII coat complex component Sec16 putative (Sec16) [Carpediemonas membranifera]
MDDDISFFDTVADIGPVEPTIVPNTDGFFAPAPADVVNAPSTTIPVPEPSFDAVPEDIFAPAPADVVNAPSTTIPVPEPSFDAVPEDIFAPAPADVVNAPSTTIPVPEPSFDAVPEDIFAPAPADVVNAPSTTMPVPEPSFDAVPEDIFAPAPVQAETSPSPLIPSPMPPHARQTMPSMPSTFVANSPASVPRPSSVPVRFRIRFGAGGRLVMTRSNGFTQLGPSAYLRRTVDGVPTIFGLDTMKVPIHSSPQSVVPRLADSLSQQTSGEHMSGAVGDSVMLWRLAAACVETKLTPSAVVTPSVETNDKKKEARATLLKRVLDALSASSAPAPATPDSVAKAASQAHVLSPASVAKVQELAMHGDLSEAVGRAKAEGLWSHAILLSSLITDQEAENNCYDTIVEYAETLAVGSPLRALYLMMAHKTGRTKLTNQPGPLAANWRGNVAVLVKSRSSPEYKIEVLDRIQNELINGNRLAAAHFLRLVTKAGMGLPTGGGGSDRIGFPGSDHRGLFRDNVGREKHMTGSLLFANAPALEGVSVLSVLLAEAFHHLSADEELRVPPYLMPFLAALALLFFDHGMPGIALLYAKAVRDQVFAYLPGDVQAQLKAGASLTFDDEAAQGKTAHFPLGIKVPGGSIEKATGAMVALYRRSQSIVELIATSMGQEKVASILSRKDGQAMSRNISFIDKGRQLAQKTIAWAAGSDDEGRGSSSSAISHAPVLTIPGATQSVPTSRRPSVDSDKPKEKKEKPKKEKKEKPKKARKESTLSRLFSRMRPVEADLGEDMQFTFNGETWVDANGVPLSGETDGPPPPPGGVSTAPPVPGVSVSIPPPSDMGEFNAVPAGPPMYDLPGSVSASSHAAPPSPFDAPLSAAPLPEPVVGGGNSEGRRRPAGRRRGLAGVSRYTAAVPSFETIDAGMPGEGMFMPDMPVAQPTEVASSMPPTFFDPNS